VWPIFCQVGRETFDSEIANAVVVADLVDNFDAEACRQASQ